MRHNTAMAEDLPPPSTPAAPPATAGDWPENSFRLNTAEGRIWAFLASKFSAREVLGMKIGALQAEIRGAAKEIGCTCGDTALHRALNRVIQELEKAA
jgi:hypothetical protein